VIDRRRAGHRHDAVEERKALQFLLDLRPLLGGIDEDDGRLGVMDDVADLFGRARRINAGWSAARRHAREGGDRPLRTIGGEDADRAAGGNAAGNERFGDAPHDRDVIGPRGHLPGITRPNEIRRILGPLLGMFQEAVGDRIARHGPLLSQTVLKDSIDER
jgi:hypothetical protein